MFRVQLNYEPASLKGRARTVNSGLNGILEIREHDIPYQLRVCIDLGKPINENSLLFCRCTSWDMV